MYGIIVEFLSSVLWRRLVNYYIMYLLICIID